jgi:hypothetical protein
MADIPGQAIDAALNAYVEYWREAPRGARQVVWTSPAREQVRQMLAAAVPFTDAAERDRNVAMLRALAAGEVPGIVRKALEDAAVTLGAREVQERSDEEAP